jgi:hypothetical protein
MSYKIVLESYQDSCPDEGVTHMVLNRTSDYKTATSILDDYVKALEELGFEGTVTTGFKSKFSNNVYTLEVIRDYDDENYSVAEFIRHIKDYMDE